MIVATSFILAKAVSRDKQDDANILKNLVNKRGLPDKKVQGYTSAWPAIVRDEMEILQMEVQPMRIRPSSQDISEMEEVIFVWLRWLDVEQRKLVWLRAERVR